MSSQLASRAASVVDPDDFVARSAELEERMAVAAGQRNRLHGELVAMAAEALEHELCLGADLPLARWVAWRLGCEPTTAQRIAAVAERRRELPTLTAAMEAGSISLAQAAVIARRVPASHEAQAVRQAEVLRPAQLRRYCQTLPPLDEELDEPRRAAKRFRLSLYPDDDGDFRLSGLLPADIGAGFDTALRAQLDALWNETSAEAMTESSDDRSPAPTLVDALARLTEQAQSAEAAARPHHQRTRTIVHVDLTTKVGQFHLGPAIPDSVRRFLTCDSTFEVVFEAFGRVVGSGRSTQQINRRLRQAIERRDGGCRVSGCGSRYVQIHHVRHWEDGGVTETWNLIALCPHHHRAHHHGRLGITGSNADDPDGITFTDASGRVMRPRPRPAPAGDLPPPPDGAPYERPEIGRLPADAFFNDVEVERRHADDVATTCTRSRRGR